MTASYDPGHGKTMLELLRVRRASEFAGFFLPYLAPGQRLLDVGCSEGGLTLELAEHVAPGRVVGVDAEPAMARAAAEAAASSCSTQVRFETASAEDLPFADASFDRVFAHALLEHLPEPLTALREFGRVLAPGGLLGVASSDWGGALLLPERPGLRDALAEHLAARVAAGADPCVAHRFADLLAEAGFEIVDIGARYECEAPPQRFADYLAARRPEHRAGVEAWLHEPGALYAMAWVHAVGRA
jgi:ubiquinone/menaquinone biosynthesis C-methylase UbiE